MDKYHKKKRQVKKNRQTSRGVTEVWSRVWLLSRIKEQMSYPKVIATSYMATHSLLLYSSFFLVMGC
jgi:hypothetical protein